ncbi:docking protein 1 isoform X2 [Panthera uncia]|uniref:docking protein 1 isoform X2 n=1 Tax=Panthera uncia TaxID=29064 RepID=UPI0020FFAF5D|nr:docking protein 1 isoform X2 [Panthera uncia]
MHRGQEATRGGGSYSSKGPELAQTLGTAWRELRGPRYCSSLYSRKAVGLWRLLRTHPSFLPWRCWRTRCIAPPGKVMFSFEAGRRCPSGPGTFTFQTAQGNDIFQAVETAIHRQKVQGKDGQGQDSLRADSHEGEAAEGKLVSLPGPQELPGTPPALYAEPLDSLRIPSGPSQDSLYSDPLDSTPARAGEAAQLKKPLYWELYQHVQQQLLKAKLTDPKEDPIYDEPEGLAPAALRGLYDLPQEPKDAWWCQARVKEEGYELPYNPATDDYEVPPPPRSTKPLLAPKPRGRPFPEPGVAAGGGGGGGGGGRGHSSDTVLYSQVQKSGGAPGSWDCGLSRAGAEGTKAKAESST